MFSSPVDAPGSVLGLFWTYCRVFNACSGSEVPEHEHSRKRQNKNVTEYAVERNQTLYFHRHGDYFIVWL